MAGISALFHRRDMVVADTRRAGVMQRPVMCHQCDGVAKVVIFSWWPAARIVALGGCVTRQISLEWAVTNGFQRLALSALVK